MCQWKFISIQIIFHSHFNFSFVLQNFIEVVLVVVVSIIVLDEVIPLMISFRIPHINKTKSMFIQYFNFAILVYIPTTIYFCNHMPQFKNTVSPVVMLEHVGKLLLKISIDDMYVYYLFVESLHYKALIFCLCGLFYGNSLLIWTTLRYNPNSAIQGVCQLLLKIYVTDLYAHCIFVEYLRYKELIFCLWGSFGRNRLLILSTF